MRTISPKQERFVEEYLVDLNATQAAIRSGYSKRTAGKLGYQLLGKPLVAEAIAKAREKLSERTEITQERVLAEYAKIAFIDPKAFYDEDGELKKIPDLDEKVAAALAGFEVTSVGDEILIKTSKIKLCNKIGALDSIAKHLGMFTSKHELTGPNGAPIPLALDLSSLSNERLREIITGTA